MSLKRTLIIASTFWVVLITALHVQLNTRWRPWSAAAAAEGDQKFRVGFLPVT